MYKWQDLDRDHLVDRVLGGAQGPAVLAHRSCNRGAGAKLGNRLQPRAIQAAGRDTVCAACGKPYHYAARACEVCGVHYHPSGKAVRTCSRAHGVELRRRLYGYAGSKASKPKPPPRVRVPAEPYAPRSTVAYYTCRYCGKPGVTMAKGQRREVCPARECQLARLTVNNLVARKGMTREQAEAAVAAYRAEGDHRGLETEVRRTPHRCSRCGQQTVRYRWCDECLCTEVNAKGRRCGNAASTDGRCDYHAEQASQPAASRQW